MKFSEYIRKAQGNKPRDPDTDRWNYHPWILSFHLTRGKYNSHFHMKHDFLVPPAFRWTKTTPQKGMNFPFHVCRETTEKRIGDPLKTAAAKCITAKEFTVSFYRRYLHIAYQEEVYFIVSSSLSENTGHLRDQHDLFLCFSLPHISCCHVYFPFYISRLLGLYYCST